MRLYEYITETKGIPTNQLPQIIDEAQPYVNDIARSSEIEFLYSGRIGKPPMFRSKVRKNRKPKDMPLEVHNLLDDLFEEKFGVRARSESLFCLTSPKVAENYGNPYIILPIGKYKPIWSPQVHDLYGKLNTFVREDFEIKHAFQKWNNIESETQQEILDSIKKDMQRIIETWYSDDFRMKNTGPGLTGNHEIMLVCEEYIGISNEYEEDVEKMIKERVS